MAVFTCRKQVIVAETESEPDHGLSMGSDLTYFLKWEFVDLNRSWVVDVIRAGWVFARLAACSYDKRSLIPHHDELRERAVGVSFILDFSLLYLEELV